MNELRPALMALLVFTLLTGVAYPLAVTGVAQVAFPTEANGSLVKDPDGTVRGSALVGQGFSRPEHFWARPSAAGQGYDAIASAGSNYGNRHPDLLIAVDARVAALQGQGPVPVDLVTASGSGLDPHITPAAAYHQVARVARARGLPADKVKALVDAHVEGRWLGFLGEPVVNVLALNRDLDRR